MVPEIIKKISVKEVVPKRVGMRGDERELGACDRRGVVFG